MLYCFSEAFSEVCLQSANISSLLNSFLHNTCSLSLSKLYQSIRGASQDKRETLVSMLESFLYRQYICCKKVGFLFLQISLVTDFAVGVDVFAHEYFYQAPECLPLETNYQNYKLTEYHFGCVEQ